MFHISPGTFRHSSQHLILFVLFCITGSSLAQSVDTRKGKSGRRRRLSFAGLGSSQISLTYVETSDEPSLRWMFSISRLLFRPWACFDLEYDSLKSAGPGCYTRVCETESLDGKPGRWFASSFSWLEVSRRRFKVRAKVFGGSDPRPLRLRLLMIERLLRSC